MNAVTRSRTRTALLTGAAIGVISLAGAAGGAFAAGGKGGSNYENSGAGGTPANPNGGRGSPLLAGGGGGGPGVVGGNGGDGGGGAAGGAGGRTANNPNSPNGGDGASGSLSGGGGGGGGANGTPDNARGGNGGKGGNGGSLYNFPANRTDGGSGGGGGAGGYGLVVEGNGGNTATVVGGNGGGGGYGSAVRGAVGGSGGGGGDGGIGVSVTGNNVTFTNAPPGPDGGGGTIQGGAGGAGGLSYFGTGGNGGAGGAGGIGVSMTGNNVTFINTGFVRGGAGGQGGIGGGADVATNGVSGLGGAGVSFSGNNATLINSAFVDGGVGGQGVDGFGTQSGGTGGATGGNGVEFLGAGGSVTNSAPPLFLAAGIRGGEGGANDAPGGLGGTGGIGVFFANGGSVTTAPGTLISGGVGGVAGFENSDSEYVYGTGGTGGVGVAGSGLTITNAGLIAGGTGGPALPVFGGGDGIGGNGSFGNGGVGGVGISGSNLNITNTATGVITGGQGGDGGFDTSFQPVAFNGGNGGIGILADGATIINAGLIQGGNGGGGARGGRNGVGGVGIVGSNLTIANAGGTISGGIEGTAVTPPIQILLKILAVQPAPANGGNQAYAIQFTGGTNYVGTGGTINGGIYVGAGSFQPALNGTTPGTPLTVNGPINFAPGSFYNVRITPTANDRAIASTSINGAAGIATLTGAGVNASFANGTYQTGRYTILTANAGVVGQFATLTTSLNSAFLSPFLSYDPTNVYLNIAVTNPTRAGTPNYVPAAITYNQISVASGLTQAGIQNGGRGPILNALNQLSAPQARAAFDALSGEGITGAQNSAFRQSQLFNSSISDQTTFGTAANSVELCEPLYSKFLPPDVRRRCEPIRELADLPARNFQPIAPASGTRTWRAWASGWGGTEHLSGNAFPTGSASQSNSLYGGSLGVDYQVLPNYLIGVAVGGSNGDFRVDQRGTYGTTTGGHIAIYDLLTLGNWYGASSSSFSYFGNKTTRFVSGFGGLGSETLRGNFDSNEFRSRLEIGRHFSSLPFFGGLPALSGFGTVTPFVALELASLRSNGFTEYATRGAGLFRLNVSGQSIGSAPAYAGLRFQRVTPLGNGMVLSPTLQLAYVHEFAPYRNQIGTLANLPGSTFLVDGARPARDAAQVKAGAELALGPHSAVFANFDGEFSRVNQLYAGKGGFRYTW